MFSKAYCISLDRREDRASSFLNRAKDLPFNIEMYPAIDGKLCKHPVWWKAGGGAWGCYKSHLNIIEQCLMRGDESVLIFEDDAIPIENFNNEWELHRENIPQDWGMLYLGGQHLFAKRNPPIKVNDYWYMPYNVNRTHAYAVHKRFMVELYKHLNNFKNWPDAFHIDHHYGSLHQLRKYPIYTPSKWLIGQAEGKSDICGREVERRFWPNAQDISYGSSNKFVAVIGLHRSGSSCVAMMLHKLGVHMGNKLIGYERTGGGEAVTLAHMCEEYCPFPSVNTGDIYKLRSRLSRFINDKKFEANNKNTIAGGKYPTMCLMGDLLEEICGDNLLIIHCDRPLEDSIKSLQRRSSITPAWQHITDEQCENVQKMLWTAKNDFIRRRKNRLDINYYNLLNNPRDIVSDIITYLDICPSQEQIEDAIKHVDPNQRNI